MTMESEAPYRAKLEAAHKAHEKAYKPGDEFKPNGGPENKAVQQAEKDLVMHWLDEGRATEIIAIMDARHAELMKGVSKH
jgi:hypothetical protein